MDTLKSIAVVSLLAAVLYGVYVVANKPDQASPEMAAVEQLATPVVETGPKISPPTFAPPTVAPASNVAEYNTQSYPRSGTAPKTLDGSGVERSVYEERTPEPKSAPLLPNPPAEEGSVYGKPNEEPKNDVASSYGALQPETSTTPPSDTSSSSSNSVSGAPTDFDIEAAKLRARHYAFVQTWKAAREQVMDGHYREAMKALSAFYHDPAVPADEHQQLVDWLDSLAAKVVYGTEHLLEEPYVAKRNETLYAVADQYNVPYLLLKNINGVRDPEILLPGQKLKVIRGPFRADVSLQRKEITLFVDDLYAGRFAFELFDTKIQPGQYKVVTKEDQKNYHGTTTIPPNDPRNPYGGIWIDLGRDVGLHGSSGDGYAVQQGGSIGLATHDAKDLFGILSKGSVVNIK